MCCPLAKLFDCQIPNSFKVLEMEGGNQSLGWQLGACLSWAIQLLAVDVHCSHWPFWTKELRVETGCWFCTWVQFYYSVCIKEKASVVALIFFSGCVVKESRNDCTQHETLFSTWNYCPHRWQSWRNIKLALNMSGSRQFYTKFHLIQLYVSAIRAISAHTLHWDQAN